MLGSADLNWMRDALEELMPETCTILSQTNTSDGQGGWTTTWGTVAINVKCRIDPGRKEMYERVTGAALQPYSWWWLTLPHDTAIDETCRVVVNGDTYNVVNHDDNKSWPATLRVVVMKLSPLDWIPRSWIRSSQRSRERPVAAPSREVDSSSSRRSWDPASTFARRARKLRCSDWARRSRWRSS